MDLSATYICPRRGIASLEPPDAKAAHQGSSAARELGIERLIMGVPEEALTVSKRNKVAYFDGLVHALDHVLDAGLQAWLLAPAHELLGVVWAPPYLVKPVPAKAFRPVFVDRKLRSLQPYAWWTDPALLQKRIMLLAELARAVLGHPALYGWLAMDGILDWHRPDAQAADYYLKALLAEIRQRDDKMAVFVRTDWRGLLAPGFEGHLATQADGLQLGTQRHVPPEFPAVTDTALGMHLAAFAGILAGWLWNCPVHVELGWHVPTSPGGFERSLEHAAALGRSGLAGVVWPTLADPQPALRTAPPWSLDARLSAQGILSTDGVPKDGAADWLKALRAGEPPEDPCGFIDIDREEYLADPAEHFHRLWNYYREGL